MNVSICFYINDYHTVEGRLLGLVDQDQFGIIYQQPKFITEKLLELPSTTLKDVVNYLEDPDNKSEMLRMAIATKDKRVFVSGIIDDLYSVIRAGGVGSKVTEIQFLDSESNWYSVEED